MFKVGVFILATVVLQQVAGHGMVLDPPNRSSLWRFDPSAPVNYEDNENFCGGFGIHWGVHGGKCGVCGDNYGDPVPRDNENTGTYGRGKIAATYQSGSVIDVYVKLTTNHKGWFNFSVCKISDSSKPETDDCFQPVLYEDGSELYEISPSQKEFNLKLRLPEGLKCQQCVLRWNYKTGNSWGECEDGSGAMGCGPQEHFRSCSDIAIV